MRKELPGQISLVMKVFLVEQWDLNFGMKSPKTLAKALPLVKVTTSGLHTLNSTWLLSIERFFSETYFIVLGREIQKNFGALNEHIFWSK